MCFSVTTQSNIYTVPERCDLSVHLWPQLTDWLFDLVQQCFQVHLALFHRLTSRGSLLLVSDIHLNIIHMFIIMLHIMGKCYTFCLSWTWGTWLGMISLEFSCIIPSLPPWCLLSIVLFLSNAGCELWTLWGMEGWTAGTCKPRLHDGFRDGCVVYW